jgi:NAD+ synthase
MIPQLKLDNRSVKNLLTGFIKKEITRVGLSRAVLGLSGGIDSALVVYLAAEALGSDNILAVMMPYKDSNPDSLIHARMVAEKLSVPYEVVEITPMVAPLFESDTGMSNVRKGNIMARQRMIVLFDRSARDRSLVLGTGNKTEILLGYSTLYGDSACALNPIGDLYKSQVWKLSEYLGIPREIREKEPSADLWIGQTDEHELGFSYKHVDELLYFMVDERLNKEELTERGFEINFISKVRKLIVKNQFKRVPPLIAKVSDRTVNVDFRYPRDWDI